MAQHDLTELVTRIQAAGGTPAQLLALPDVDQYAGQIFAWNRRSEAAAHELVSGIEEKVRRAAAPAVKPQGPLATDAQVDYALDLIARRIQSGEAGGHLSFSGGYPTAETMRKMSRRQASSLISQMRDAWA